MTMPLFTIKAKDVFAIPMLRRYVDLCYDFGLPEQAGEVERAIAEMEDWQAENRDLVKLPYHEHVPAS